MTTWNQIAAWTPDRVQTLRDMWGAGKPVKTIAGELGITKGAVIGKANRIGLPRHVGASDREPGVKELVSRLREMRRQARALA